MKKFKSFSLFLLATTTLSACGLQLSGKRVSLVSNLNQGEEANSQQYEVDQPQNPLIIAIREENEKEVRAILKRGDANLNAYELDGRRPLVVAVEVGNLQIAKMLVHYGASLESIDEAIEFAQQQKEMEIFAYLEAHAYQNKKSAYELARKGAEDLGYLFDGSMTPKITELRDKVSENFNLLENSSNEVERIENVKSLIEIHQALLARSQKERMHAEKLSNTLEDFLYHLGMYRNSEFSEGQEMGFSVELDGAYRWNISASQSFYDQNTRANLNRLQKTLRLLEPLYNEPQVEPIEPEGETSSEEAEAPVSNEPTAPSEETPETEPESESPAEGIAPEADEDEEVETEEEESLQDNPEESDEE